MCVEGGRRVGRLRAAEHLLECLLEVLVAQGVEEGVEEAVDVAEPDGHLVCGRGDTVGAVGSDDEDGDVGQPAQDESTWRAEESVIRHYVIFYFFVRFERTFEK